MARKAHKQTTGKACLYGGSEMKKLVLIGLILAMAVVVSGCAAKIGGTSIRPTNENNLEEIREALTENKTIYYKVVYCEDGWLNWSIVKEPMANPDEITKKAGEMFVKKTEELFKERGFILKRTDNFSPSSPNVQIEIRISARDMQKRILFVPTGEQTVIGVGTRWFVYYHTNNNPLELYDYQLKSAFQESTLEEIINKLVPRVITALLDA